MRKIICGIPECSKCKMLKMSCPDTELVELDPLDLLNFAKAVGIKSVPFIVITGEPDELSGVLKQKEE